MSLYNMVNKVNPSAFFILPLLDNGHPDNWPRFRDCFVTVHQFKVIDGLPLMSPVDEKEEPSSIYVLLRIGGGNRSSYAAPWEKIKSHPNYKNDWDDAFDSTFCHVHFSIPDKWKDDYNKVMNSDYMKTSVEYQKLLYDTYPKLKDVFDKLFKK